VRYLFVRYVVCAALVGGLIGIGLCTSGCASDTATTKPGEDPALKDPMNYGKDDEPETVSGNNPNGIDKKAMQKDVDHFWNP
jgi:hypothetical protein